MSIGLAECKEGMALLASHDVPITLLKLGICLEAEGRKGEHRDGQSLTQSSAVTCVSKIRQPLRFCFTS